eukprot:s296_g8.t1
MLPRRSWLGVCVALYVHLWRSHRKIVDKLEGASYEERFVIDFASEPRGRTGACSATAGCDQVHLASNIGCRAKNQCNGDATELVWQNGSAHA